MLVFLPLVIDVMTTNIKRARMTKTIISVLFSLTDSLYTNIVLVELRHLQQD